MRYKEERVFFEDILEILKYQLRQGLHITNIENIEKTVTSLKGKIEPIYLMELNGIISQIKLDIANANIDRDKAMHYRREFETVLSKIRN